MLGGGGLCWACFRPHFCWGGGGSKRPAPLFPGPQGGPAHGLHPRFVVAEIWADKGGGGGGGGGRVGGGSGRGSGGGSGRESGGVRLGGWGGGPTRGLGGGGSCRGSEGAFLVSRVDLPGLAASNSSKQQATARAKWVKIRTPSWCFGFQ